MRSVVFAALLASAVAANVQDRAVYEEKFFAWLAEYKVKPSNGEQFVHMLQNFADNHDLIEATNAKNLSYKLGHNKFSHLSVDEWRKAVRLGLDRPSPEAKADSVHAAPANLMGVATTVDWRNSNAVTGVKDQGSCGSCWSFSTTGALEGAYAIKNSQLQSFSEQQLVDCDTLGNGGRDHGCNGGLMDNAFSWIKKNGGLCTEAAYPYTSGTTQKSGTCQTSCSEVSGSTVASYVDVATNSDSALVSALNVGPVSVAIEADQAAFQLYKSGVFTAACGTSLDHGVLAVGYDADSWIVKNSWGTSWGESGYIRMGRGSSYQKEGQCGILSGPPSYPKL